MLIHRLFTGFHSKTQNQTFNMPAILDHEESFTTILTVAIGVASRASQYFRADFTTLNDLQSIDATTFNLVITTLNKTYRHHETQNARAYVNALQTTRLRTLAKWVKHAIVSGGGVYSDEHVGDFTREWINSIRDEYMLKDPEVTTGASTVDVDKFDGSNWFTVKTQLSTMLSTRIGHNGIPLSYLIRNARILWNDTEGTDSLESRRIATQCHEGPEFDRDNSEFFRILHNHFAESTLADVVNVHLRNTDGIAAWTAIRDNVEGTSYPSELKRQANDLISKAFFDPNRNYTLDQYFKRHAQSHALMTQAGAPVAEWKKIEDFVAGIRFNKLQDDYRTLKDDDRYNTSFTRMYNKLNENYRFMIQNGQIRAPGRHKRNIGAVNTPSDNDRHQGRGRGRGRGGRKGGRFGGRGGRSGRGGRFGRGSGKDQNLNTSILPPHIDLNSTDFLPPDQWQALTSEQRTVLNQVRRNNNTRRVNALQSQLQYNPYSQPQYNPYDDISTISSSIPRSIAQMNTAQQIPSAIPLPPPPPPRTPSLPPSNAGTAKVSFASSNSAGSAFGRRGPGL